MFYLTTHSTHFIYGYMASKHMVENHSDSERGNPLPPYGLLFLISTWVILYALSHIPRPWLHQSWSTGWNENAIYSQSLVAMVRFILQKARLVCPTGYRWHDAQSVLDQSPLMGSFGLFLIAANSNIVLAGVSNLSVGRCQ